MYRFVEKNLSTGQTRKFETPPFSSDTKALLDQFVECTNALNDTAFVRNWDSVRISIRFPKKGQVTDESSLPQDEALATYLHRLRPIYLKNEPSNFNRIANLVSEHFCDQWVTALIRECKRHYDGRSIQEVFKMEAGGMLINSQEFLDHYLNALEYHRDVKRRAHIDRIAKHLPIDVQKPFVVLLLAHRLNAINKLAGFISMCFYHESGGIMTLES